MANGHTEAAPSTTAPDPEALAASLEVQIERVREEAARAAEDAVARQETLASELAKARALLAERERRRATARSYSRILRVAELSVRAGELLSELADVAEEIKAEEEAGGRELRAAAQAGKDGRPLQPIHWPHLLPPNLPREWKQRSQLVTAYVGRTALAGGTSYSVPQAEAHNARVTGLTKEDVQNELLTVSQAAAPSSGGQTRKETER